MDSRIEDFISSNSVFTLCTSESNRPYCASCMYSYLPAFDLLVFSSEQSTRHITEACLNANVAGTILPTKMQTGALAGIQFTGEFVTPERAIISEARKVYYLKYPFALAMKGQLWFVKLKTVKMTDNSLGFGKKILWQESVKNES